MVNAPADLGPTLADIELRDAAESTCRLRDLLRTPLVVRAGAGASTP